ncbi:MAG: alanyl-tRNA editing protein [Legionellales bacterium RIFCSPHIGHO2_12_FULL_37_14]|nr:MAG: alanyl-tRNA editing protein [Legionellales bacterium RIFCSPHIGHO2_12_FULL_37_14]
MRKVFWDNSYQHDLTTTVTAVNGNEILLAETIAYSFSGGQESDKAFINGCKVLNSKMVEHLIYYTLPEGHGLAVGDQVKMEIDWPRRHRLMRLHFAAELVLEIVTQHFQLEKTGAHISEEKARIDFRYTKNISCLFEIILGEYNKIIQENKPIQTGYSDVQNQRRFWKIDGFAQVPCGGTHVKSTTEVGFVTLKRVNAGKFNERIEIKLVDDSVPSSPSSLHKI